MIHECRICHGTGKVNVSYAVGLMVHNRTENCPNPNCRNGFENDSPFLKECADKNQQSLNSFK